MSAISFLEFFLCAQTCKHVSTTDINTETNGKKMNSVGIRNRRWLVLLDPDMMSCDKKRGKTLFVMNF